jgi:hypothetical protein
MANISSSNINETNYNDTANFTEMASFTEIVNFTGFANFTNNINSNNSRGKLIKPMEWVQTNNCLCEAGEVCTRPLKYKVPPVCSHPDIGVDWQQYIRQPPVQQQSNRLEFGILFLLQAFFILLLPFLIHSFSFQLLIIGLLIVAIWKIKGRPSRRHRRRQQQQDPNGEFNCSQIIFCLFLNLFYFQREPCSR